MTAKRLTALCAALLALLLSTQIAQGSTYRIDTDYSAISLSGFGASVGKFTGVSGALVYDPIHVDRSQVVFSVPMKNLNVLANGLDVHLGGHLFCDIEKYPEITFTSTQVVPHGDVLRVSGTLSFLGVSREVTLPVEILGRGTHPKTGEPIAGFSAKMKIRLTDYGVDAWTRAAGLLGDQISLHVQVVGVKDESLSIRKTTINPTPVR